MADDIQLGMDNSGALRGFAQMRQASEDFAKSLGLTTQQAAKFDKAIERSMATGVAGAMKNAAAQQQVAAAHKTSTGAINSQAEAAARLAAAEKKAFDALNLARNSGGRVVNKDTGTFATKAQIDQARNLQHTLQQTMDLEDRLERMRAINAQNAARRSQAQAQQTAHAANQARLNATFGAGATVGSAATAARLAAPPVGAWQRFSAVLATIPPVSMIQGLGKATNALLEMDNGARYALYSVAAGAAVASAGFIAFGASAIKAAVDHERAFANVARTTQTTAAGYQFLQRELEEMAMVIPVNFEELTKIAAAAGQLGIEASGITNFTKTIAMLTATTNLTSDAAGNALARFKAFFSAAEDPAMAVTEATFSNLASSILKVGVNSIATETGIVNVSTQISSMGKMAGLTANQVIGFAGALSSVGVAPELARGITTRLFTIMGDAVSASGVQLEKFASLSGVSAEEFKSAWGTDKFAPVFTGFLKGLNSVTEGGGDANSALRDLGITAVRDRPVWLRLATAAGETGKAGTLLAQTLEDAEQGWVANTELAMQYGKVAATASSRIQVLAQSFEQLFASLGEESGNFVGELAAGLTVFVRAMEEFAQSDVGKVFGVFVVQGALVMGAIFAVIGVLAGLAATIQGVGAAFVSMSATGVGAAGRLGAAFKLASLSLGLIGLIGTIVALAGTFAFLGSEMEKANSPVQDWSGLLAAMKSDAEAGGNGIKFYSDANSEASVESKKAAKTANSMTEALYGIKEGSAGAGGALSGVANSANEASHVFGKAATLFYKSQLTMDEGFQKLFDQDTNAGKLLDKFDIKPELFNWDAIIKESIREGGDVTGKVMQEIQKQSSGDFDMLKGEGSFVTSGFQVYASEVTDALGNISPMIRQQIAAQNALADNTKYSVNEMVDDYELLDEVTAKTVNSMASGFMKFTETGGLLSLTQQMVEAAAVQDDLSTETDEHADAAVKYKKAWEDAYGGSQFKLEDYLTTFRNAATEQTNFINNLSLLSARGLDPKIIQDLAAMGPEANRLVQALIDGTDAQLTEFENLWGSTGYDSMIQLATQAAIGQEIVKAVFARGGLAALQQFNAAIASGVGVNAALAELQLDVNGKPIKPAVSQPANLTPGQIAIWQRSQAVWVPVTPYLTKKTIYVSPITPTAHGSYAGMQMYAEGGYTGPGGKYDAAGTVHKGEFVMDAQATRAIGVNNLYAMMNSARGGRSAPRGRGYSSGGEVSSSGTQMVYLSPEDRDLLRAAGNVRLTIGTRDVAIAQAEANFTATRQGG